MDKDLLVSELLFLHDRLSELHQDTLVHIIGELNLKPLTGKFEEMSLDVLGKAKFGFTLSEKQKRVLVNIITKGEKKNG